MLEWVLSSSVLILVLLLLRRVLRGKISLGLQYGLWAVVLLRLLLPFSLAESTLSVMNAVEGVPVVQDAETLEGYEHIDYIDGRVEAYPYSDMMWDDPTVIVEEASPREFQRMERVLSFQKWARLIWLMGAAVLLLFILSNARFRRNAKKGRKALDAASPVPVYVSRYVHTPCLSGFISPCIYLTPAVAEDEKVLRHVLAHEVTHYRHGDNIWAILRCLCLVLHWYNPLVWWAAVVSRRDGELACDEGAIRRLGEEERFDYGRTLIGLTVREKGSLLITATTMDGGKKTLAERVRLIAKKPRMAVYTLIAVLLVAAVAVACTFTGAKEGDGGAYAKPLESYLSDFFGVSQTNSQDWLGAVPGQVPSLDWLLGENGPEGFGEALSGLSQAELRAAWGEPLECDRFSDWFLSLESDGLLMVRYNENGTVIQAGYSRYSATLSAGEKMGVPWLTVSDGVSKMRLSWGAGTWNHTVDGIAKTESNPLVTGDYTVLAPFYTTSESLRLDFETEPDSVSVRCWDVLTEYESIAQSGGETVRCHSGSFELRPGNYIYELRAVWDSAAYSGDVTYYISVMSTCAPWPDYAAADTVQEDLSTVPQVVISHAEEYAATVLRGYELSAPGYGVTDYRVQKAELVKTLSVDGAAYPVYQVNMELYAQHPESIIPYRLGYVTGSGWFWDGYPNSLFVAVDGNGDYVTSTIFWQGVLDEETMAEMIRDTLGQ